MCNNVTYYVIEDSNTTNDTVKLLKENPLTVKEINDLNLDGITSTGDDNSYGEVPFGSSVDYSTSTVKQVVDAWKTTTVATGDTATASLITFEEVHGLGYIDEMQEAFFQGSGFWFYSKSSDTPTWVYNSLYSYITMSEYNSSRMWAINSNSNLDIGGEISTIHCVRPVLELSKSADITKID